jgi:predicted O-methyltransferase YrrM
MPNIENALKIDGWMWEDELLWLAQQAEKRNLIVEIGCWKGRSTRALADNCPGKVLAVDTWKGSDEVQHRDLLKDKPADWLIKEFMGNMAGVHVYAYQLDSLTAAETFKDELFDMVFIDAGHDYDSVKADILAWGPLIAPGGILCGHDYHSGAPGVIEAVNELLDGVKVHNSIWYVS